MGGRPQASMMTRNQVLFSWSAHVDLDSMLRDLLAWLSPHCNVDMFPAVLASPERKIRATDGENMSREQIEDDIKRLKDAHAEDQGSISSNGRFSFLKTRLLPNSAEMANSLFSLVLIFSLLLAVAADDGGAVVQQQQLWCVAKNNAEDSSLQQALDWACGPGAADCSPIQQGGPCYDPTDLIGMASYAFNDYCLKHGMTDETCNFSNTAALTALDPSHDKCKFASSSFSVGNSTTPSTAGILPGSEDMSGSCQLHVIELWTVSLVNLLAVYTVFL